MSQYPHPETTAPKLLLCGLAFSIQCRQNLTYWHALDPKGMDQTLDLNIQYGSVCPTLDKQTDAGADYIFVHNQIQSLHRERS